MYGEAQASLITRLAQRNGVDAECVVDYGDGTWRVAWK
jgi:hypothetical protein